MKIIIAIVFLYCNICQLWGQVSPLINIQTGEDYTQAFSIPPIKVIDKAKVEVLYRLEVLHDTISEDATPKNNIMALQIGEQTSKYYDFFKAKGDSIMWNADLSKKKPTEYLEEFYQMSKGCLKEEVYTDYPKKGIMTVYDHVFGGWYLYEEDIPKINWKLEEGIKTILDYPCQKATCHLFGRNYTVWYSMLIPIFKGPWKFLGLPGLILQVEDDKNQVSWTCIGLQATSSDKQMYMIGRDPIKTSKKECLSVLNDYQRNKASWIKASGVVTSEIPEKALKARAYNPIELSE